MEEVQSLFQTVPGKLLLTMAISMVPVVELRGGIPFGIALGLNNWQALCAGIIGNMIPVPFIVVYIRRIFGWMRFRFPKLGGMVSVFEKKAHIKGRKVTKYKYLGLYILVALPLPGTGAWTGALVAAFLDMRLKKAFPAILCGVITAGLIITFAAHTVSEVFF